jgi:flavorubredoxin
MSTVLIAYTTRTKKTLKIAEIIANTIREKNIDVDMKDIKEIKDAAILENYDALIFGAPTYHGKMMGTMETFLFLAEQANLEGKIGGAFGAYGWSGEAPQRIYETMRNIFKMDLVDSSLKLKNVVKPSDKQAAIDYGIDIVNKLA